MVNAQMVEAEDATVYTDEAEAYKGCSTSTRPAITAQANTSGARAAGATRTAWRALAMLKRAYVGTFRKISLKHLQRYVGDFSARHNVRELNTADQMTALAAVMAGKRLKYGWLTEGNGLPSGTRSLG